MTKRILFFDELKPVSPEYKALMTAAILQRAAEQLAASTVLKRAALRMRHNRRRKSKLPIGWAIHNNDN